MTVQVGKSQDIGNGHKVMAGNNSTALPQGFSNRTPSREDSNDITQSSSKKQPLPSPSHVGEKSDVDSDVEHSHAGPPTNQRLEMASKEEVIALYRKQDRVLTRYKTRFSEVLCIMPKIMGYSRKSPHPAMDGNIFWPPSYLDFQVYLIQGCHGQWKVREKCFFFKVREKSVNFVLGQGNLKFCTKSGKSQGNLYHFGS